MLFWWFDNWTIVNTATIFTRLQARMFQNDLSFQIRKKSSCEDNRVIKFLIMRFSLQYVFACLLFKVDYATSVFSGFAEIFSGFVHAWMTCSSIQMVLTWPTPRWCKPVVLRDDKENAAFEGERIVSWEGGKISQLALLKKEGGLKLAFTLSSPAQRAHPYPKERTKKHIAIFAGKHSPNLFPHTRFHYWANFSAEEGVHCVGSAFTSVLLAFGNSAA